MEIYLLRHGETDYNKNQIIQGSGIDSDINETGTLQSEAFFNYYKKERFNLIITSKLKRTFQTVRQFIQSDIKHQSTQLINEINWGIHEGKKGDPKLHLEYLQLKDSWRNGDLDKKIENGESARELKQRLDQFILNIKQLSLSKLLICSHGRTLTGLLALMINQSIHEMHQYKIQNTGLSKLILEDGIFKVDFINDLSHLKAYNL